MNGEVMYVVLRLQQVGIEGSVYSWLMPHGTIWVYGRILLPSIDNRVWYGIALAFMFAVSLRVLRVASNYRKRIESPDSIRFVYNEKRYKPCKEIQRKGNAEVELYRVGIRGIGNEAVESLIVVPDTLERVDDNSHRSEVISSIPLHPMTGSSETVYRGVVPSSYVDVFQHIKGTVAIFMRYDNYEREKPIVLTNGRYELALWARGKPNMSHLGIMVITMTDGDISVEMKQQDSWGG